MNELEPSQDLRANVDGTAGVRGLGGETRSRGAQSATVRLQSATRLVEEVLRVLVTEVLAAPDDLVEVSVHELVPGMEMKGTGERR